MRQLKQLALVAVLVLAAAPALRAQEKTEEKPAASQPAAPTQTLEAKDAEGIKAAVGKTVTVKGELSSVRWSPKGTILFINFKGVDRNDFIAVVEQANKAAVSAYGEDGSDLQGKLVEITGEVTLYREKPQIKIAQADQIKVTGEGKKPAEGEKPKDEDKKEEKKEEPAKKETSPSERE